jgi:hypothetical protein
VLALLPWRWRPARCSGRVQRLRGRGRLFVEPHSGRTTVLSHKKRTAPQLRWLAKV